MLGFIAALLILLPAFVMFMYFNGAKTARTAFDFQVVTTAKAAASQTYTTADGELRIDCSRALAAAADAYAKFRQVNRDQFGYRLMAGTDYSVSADCPEPGPGPGATTVTVSVVDQYTGALFTAGYFPPWDLLGGAQAALHDTSSFETLRYACEGPACVGYTPPPTG